MPTALMLTWGLGLLTLVTTMAFGFVKEGRRRRWRTLLLRQWLKQQPPQQRIRYRPIEIRLPERQ